MSTNSNYLITPALDVPASDAQLFFKFSADEQDKKFFDRIFIYNAAGFRRKFHHVHCDAKLINIVDLWKISPFFFTLFKFLRFYIAHRKNLTIGPLESLFFFLTISYILSKYVGTFFIVSEFGPRDYIFRELLASHQDSDAVFCFHSIRAIREIDRKFLLKIKAYGMSITAPSKYHEKIFRDILPVKKVLLSNYNSSQRVKSGKRLRFRENGYHLVLLNGNSSDAELIRIAEKRFGRQLIVRKHPTDNQEYMYVSQTADHEELQGVIYGTSSAVLRPEFQDIPKYHLTLRNEGEDILSEFRNMYGRNSTSLEAEKAYIQEQFCTLSSDSTYWGKLNEGFGSKRY